MNPERSLYWVQHNRTPKDRTQNVAAGVVRFVEHLLGPFARGRMTAVADSCARIVDDEFRDCCRLALTSAQTLTIVVNAPAMIPMIRRRWEREILRELSALRGGMRVTRVNFEFGTTGMTVPAAPTPAPRSRA